MILIDTDILKGLAAAARSADALLAEAAQLLNQITEHHDWGCQERVLINDKISQIRSRIGKLSQDTQSFTSVLSQISDEFVSEESSISQMFEGVESLLAHILSVSAGTGSFAGMMSGGSFLSPDGEGLLSGSSSLVEQMQTGPFSQMIQVADFHQLLEGLEAAPRESGSEVL